MNWNRQTHTDKLRARLRFHWGKRITFRIRMKNGKSKKVTGKLVYFSHRPSDGFALHLTNVKWLGQYWGGLNLKFPTKRIIWIRHDIPKLLEGGERKN